MRSLPLTLLPVLLLAAIWFHYRRPSLSATDWMVTGTILLLLSAGTHGNILRTLMPLVISDEQLDEGLDVLEAALAAAAS